MSKASDSNFSCVKKNTYAKIPNFDDQMIMPIAVLTYKHLYLKQFWLRSCIGSTLVIQAYTLQYLKIQPKQQPFIDRKKYCAKSNHKEIEASQTFSSFL
jgi:hypothetical protein